MKWLLVRPAFLYPKIYAFFCYYRKKGRRREIEQILLSLGRWNSERVKSIAMGIFERRGLKKLNRRLIPLFDPPFIEKFVGVEGRHYLDQALEGGRGVVLMSAHLGNPHLSINSMRVMGYPVKVLKGGSLRKAKVSRFEYYETWDNTVFLHDPSLSDSERKRRIVELLQSGGILYQMSDAEEGKRKQYASFFGREMGFPTGLIHLARQANAALVPLFHLYENGRLILLLKERIDNDWKNGEREYPRIIEAYAGLLEACVVDHPEQYIGFYGPTVIRSYFLRGEQDRDASGQDTRGESGQ
jgi:Kdo2-lipid IVA lauroyltransferase/acyltransferase